MIRWLVLVCAMLAGCAGQRATAPVGAGTDITVHMSSFAFAPNRLRLQAGQTVTLHLLNDATGGHDFSAPALFSSSDFPAGGLRPVDGAVEVARGQQVNVTFTPRKPGRYPVECTHFLHAEFGMTGEVVVEPAG